MSASAASQNPFVPQRTSSIREKTLLLAATILSVIVVIFVWAGAHGIGQFLIKAEAEAAALRWARALETNVTTFGTLTKDDAVTNKMRDKIELITDASPIVRYVVLDTAGERRYGGMPGDAVSTPPTPYDLEMLSAGRIVSKVVHDDVIGAGRTTRVIVHLPLKAGDAPTGSVQIAVDMTARAKQMRGIAVQFFSATILVFGAFWGMTSYVVWRNHKDYATAIAGGQPAQSNLVGAVPAYAMGLDESDQTDESEEQAVATESEDDFGIFGRYE